MLEACPAGLKIRCSSPRKHNAPPPSQMVMEEIHPSMQRASPQGSSTRHSNKVLSECTVAAIVVPVMCLVLFFVRGVPGRWPRSSCGPTSAPLRCTSRRRRGSSFLLATEFLLVVVALAPPRGGQR
eukprot:RCo053897